MATSELYFNSHYCLVWQEYVCVCVRVRGPPIAPTELFFFVNKNSLQCLWMSFLFSSGTPKSGAPGPWSRRVFWATGWKAAPSCLVEPISAWEDGKPDWIAKLRGPGSAAADLVPCLSASQKCCIYYMPQRLCNCISSFLSFLLDRLCSPSM